MAGSLHHARSFEKRFYRGMDGLQHWELEHVEGDLDVVSHSTWWETVDHCARLGVPEEVWPFFDCSCGIDVPLEDAYAMQADFRAALGELRPADVSSHELLSRIVSYLDRGEVVFFTD